MSLPNNRLASENLPSLLLTPDTLGRQQDRTVDFERGGAGLNDPSQGLDVQNWRARIVGEDVFVGIHPGGAETKVITVAGITEVSLAFDQNMRPSLAYIANGAAKLYWYDSSLPGQTTTTVGACIRSPFITLDDKRDGVTAQSDILMFYFRESGLYYRQQRERFGFERLLASFVSNTLWISRAGMNSALRMQIEVQGADLSRP